MEVQGKGSEDNQANTGEERIGIAKAVPIFLMLLSSKGKRSQTEDYRVSFGLGGVSVWDKHSCLSGQTPTMIALPVPQVRQASGLRRRPFSLSEGSAESDDTISLPSISAAAVRRQSTANSIEILSLL